VGLPAKVWPELARFDAVPQGAKFLRWVPLALAPEWAEAHTDEPERPGPEWLADLFRALAAKASSSQTAAAPPTNPPSAAP
jgi:hypothetical protein